MAQGHSAFHQDKRSLFPSLAHGFREPMFARGGFHSGDQSPSQRPCETIMAKLGTRWHIRGMAFHVRHLHVRGWLAILLSLGAVLAIGVAVTVVALGIFLVLLPALLAATAFYYLFARLRRRQGRKMGEPDIIDGEYRVLDVHGSERKPLK
jgi:hypothetical protein